MNPQLGHSGLLEHPHSILPPGLRPYHLPFYYASIAIGTSGAPTDSNQAVQVGPEDFLLLGIGASSVLRTTLIRIVEDGTGINFMSGYVSLTKLIRFGAKFEFLKVGLKPYLIKGGNSVTLQARNTDAAISRLGVTLFGVRWPKNVEPPQDLLAHPPYFLTSDLASISTEGQVSVQRPTPRVGDLPFTLVAVGLDIPTTDSPRFAFYGPNREEFFRPRSLASSLTFADASTTGREPVYPLPAKVKYPAHSGIGFEIENAGATAQGLNAVFIGYQDRPPRS